MFLQKVITMKKKTLKKPQNTFYRYILHLNNRGLKHFSLIHSLFSGMTTPVEERKVLRFCIKKDARIGIKKTGFFLYPSF